MLLKRIAIRLAVAGAMLVGGQGMARGQQGPGPMPPELMQQMQEMQQQMLQNMQAKGINPQEFFGQIVQQLQDGSFDPADFQQLMVDKGIIDQQMISKMQDTVQRVTMGSIKQMLGASDEDWKIIQAKIQKVVVARAGAEGSMGGGGGMMVAAAVSGANEAAKAMKELREAVKDATTPADVIAAKLHAWREARLKARAELAAAQKELTEILTVRQEGILANLGLLP